MDDQFQINKSKNEVAGLSIKDLFFKYIKFLPFFVLSVALALFGAYTYLRYATPIYQSSGSLIIKEDKKSAQGKLSELMTTTNEVNVQNEIEQLKSRPMMERVVKALDLNYTYYAKGKVKESNIYKSAPFALETLQLADSSSFALNIHFKNAHSFRVNNGESLISFGQVFKTAHGTFRLVKTEGVIGEDYIVTWHPTASIASSLASSLVVLPKPHTNILILTLESTHPQLAADVINRLMQEYRIHSVMEKNETINQQLVFINDRIKVVDRELDSITSNLLAFQRANNLVSFEVQSSGFFEKLSSTDKSIAEQMAQMEILNLIESYIRNSKNNFSTTPSTLSIADPTLAVLIGAYNATQLERKELLDQRIPANNPLVTAKEDRIEKLRLNILENIRLLRTSYNAVIGDLRRENALARTQVQLLPEKQQRYIEIERAKETKQAVYDILLEERERSAITLAATTSDVRVVEEAGPNYNPIKPNKRTIQIIAIFIGLAIPALIIFAMEMLDDKVSGRNDVERYTNVTILGEVGHSFNKDPLVVTANSRGIVAEQFRIIRSNLQYVLNNISNPVLLVTSSFSGEGKSFISTNVGAVMALAGKKTIILEFDIRKPKILSHLNLPKRPGLTNYLLGKVSADELPIPVPGYDNLYVLSCGPIPPNPAEMLLDTRLNDLFHYLKTNFDTVIMDTAPVGMVSDALSLSRFADATLYIVRQGYTHKKQIGQVDDFYTQNKLPKISIVLNDVNFSRGYGNYGYGEYGYGSGYFDDEEMQKPTLLRTWLGWVGLNGKHKKKKARKEKV